jgi:cobalamin biosynthesis protein CobT
MRQKRGVLHVHPVFLEKELNMKSKTKKTNLTTTERDKAKANALKSAVLAKRLQVAINLLLGNYTTKKNVIRLIMVDNITEGPAWTNQENLTLNPGSNFFEAMPEDIEYRYSLLMGLAGHEMGHILFTNFELFSRTLEKIREKKIPPIFRSILEKFGSEEDVQNFEAAQCSFYIWKHIDNIIEDGFIERKFLSQHGNSIFGAGLTKLRKFQQEQMEKEPEDDDEAKRKGKRYTLNCLLNQMLSYGKYRKNLLMKFAEEEDAEVFSEYWERIAPIVKKATVSNSSTERMTNSLLVTFLLYPLLKEANEEGGDSDESSSGSEAAGGAMSSSVRGSRKGKPMAASESGDIADEEDDENASGGNEDSDSDADDGKGNGNDANDGDDDTDDGKGSGNDANDGDDDTDDGKGSGNDANDSDGEGDRSGKGNDGDEDADDGKDKGSRKPNKTKNMVASENENTADEIIKDSLNDLLKDILAQALDEKEQNEEIRSLNTEFKDAHLKVIPVVPNPEDAVHLDGFDELTKIARLCAKRIKVILDLVSRGGTERGLRKGRLDSKAFYKKGFNKFKKEISPEVPDLAVSILVDESGSMWMDDRWKFAKISAITLAKFTEILEIPCEVAGHTADDRTTYQTDIRIYRSFQKPRKDDFLKMVQIQPRANNRDGDAVNFCGKRLLARPETKKLLIVISDGQPWACGYSGNDLKEIVSSLKKQGVSVIAAAIGDDKDVLEKYYGSESFMDVQDLSKLPTTLTAVLKKVLGV